MFSEGGAYMKTNFMQQLQTQPKSSRELEDTIRRFEAKWQEKMRISAKRQVYQLLYIRLPNRKKTPNHLREESFLLLV